MNRLSLWIPIEPVPQGRARATIIWPGGTKKYFEARDIIVKFLSALVNRRINQEDIPARASTLYGQTCNEGPPGATKQPFVHIYPDPDSDKFQKEVKNKVIKLLKENFDYWQPLRGPLALSMTFHITKPKTVTRQYVEVKPDLDNLLKAIKDACNKILWQDDCQVVEYNKIKKIYAGADGPGIEIVLEPVGQPEFIGAQERLFA